MMSSSRTVFLPFQQKSQRKPENVKGALGNTNSENVAQNPEALVLGKSLGSSILKEVLKFHWTSAKTLVQGCRCESESVEAVNDGSSRINMNSHAAFYLMGSL